MKIPPEHIEPELKATGRDGAIRELLNRLVHAGVITHHAEPLIFAGLLQREETMSTGVGFGLAFPHTVSNLVSESVVSFGRSRAGVQFDSLDGTPVEFVFLYILPVGGGIAQVWPRRKARLADLGPHLRNCSTAEEIAAVLNRLFYDDDTSA